MTDKFRFPWPIIRVTSIWREKRCRFEVPAELRERLCRWKIVDDQDRQIAEGFAIDTGIRPTEFVAAGQLGIGWYRVEIFDSQDRLIGWTSAAVLAKLAEPLPQDSPVCLDCATSWFASGDAAAQQGFASLAALSGVNWVRDRLRWRDIQPTADKFVEHTTYDTAARSQSQSGLKVLQVFHDTPSWAARSRRGRGQFPPDLRVVYDSCKALSRRFAHDVQAWEPWNEANAASFGGHTIDQMCTYQKAAYLGLKAGNPDVIVCWNALAGTPSPIHARGVLENETWPYFQTYNIHTYDWPESYLRLWAPVREAACGRPIWVTESDRGIGSASGPPWHDLSRQHELLKAHFIAQSYASSFLAGSHRHFHFILGHYCEGDGKIQFGLLRLDQTPRPSYVALAAVGRFLAGARCLGQWQPDGVPYAHVIAFSARPDARARDVLVAWAEKPGEWAAKGATTQKWSLPDRLGVQGSYDFLGRSLGSRVPQEIGSAPLFVVLKAGDAAQLPLKSPPESTYRSGHPSPIVLQLQLPPAPKRTLAEQPWAEVHEHVVPEVLPVDLNLYAYNLADQPVQGTVRFEQVPTGLEFSHQKWEVALEPMDRVALPCRLLSCEVPSETDGEGWIKLRGDFGTSGRPTLAFRWVR